MTKKPTATEVRALLICDAATGRLVWKARIPEMFEDGERLSKETICKRWNSTYAGQEAGHQLQNGYRTIRIWDRAYQVHHIIWLIVHGEWPKELDHKNGIEAGDGICNLRPATHVQNMRNTRKRRDNKSGFKGVSWDAINNKWFVRIRVHKGKYENLGRFNNPEDGHRVYCARAVELYGEFARFE